MNADATTLALDRIRRLEAELAAVKAELGRRDDPADPSGSAFAVIAWWKARAHEMNR
jgi:hypothetical protein